MSNEPKNSYSDDVSSQIYPQRQPSTVAPTSLQNDSQDQNTLPKSPVVPASPPPAKPYYPSSQNNDYFSKHKTHHKGLLLLVLVLAFVLYLAFLYTKDFGPFGKPPFEGDQIMAGILGSLSSVNSMTYSVDLVADVEPMDSNAEPFVVKAPSGTSYKSSLLFGFLSLQSNLKNLPDGLKIDANVSGSIAKVNNRFRSDQMKVSANAFIGDNKINIDTVFNKINENDYVVANKLITLSPNDASLKSGSYFGSFLDQTSVGEIANDNTEQVRSALLLASKIKLFESKKKPEKEYMNWNSYYKYELELNKENFVEFYSDLAADLEKNNPGVRSLFVDQSTLDYIKTPEFNQAFEYLKRNSKLNLWVDSSGVPTKIQYSFKFVPVRSSSQIKFVMTVALTGVNRPISGSASIDSVIQQNLVLTGQSKEQYQFDQQLNSIATIRKALANYKKVKNVYPASLAELGEKQDISGYSYFLNVIPQDAYTNTPFVYENKGQDYVLKYNVIIPPHVPGDSAKKMFTFNYLPSSLSVVARAVDGENTANSKRQSEEAFAQSTKDTDGDKLPDLVEKYIGTGIGNKDTDNDGRSDYTEVMGDSNPLGSGILKSNGAYWF